MTTPGTEQPGVPPQVILADEQDARTRDRILTAALQVFDRKGYDAASVREIVELAGVTKPALYYHFGSKDGLLLAILQGGAREFQETMARSLERPGTTRTRVVGLCEDVYALFGKHVSGARVTHAVFLGPTDVAPNFDFSVFERTLTDALEQIVREGQARGEVTAANPADVALAVLGVVGAVAGRQLHPRTSNQQLLGLEGLRRLLDLVFDGVLKDGTHAQAAGETRQ